VGLRPTAWPEKGTQACQLCSNLDIAAALEPCARLTRMCRAWPPAPLSPESDRVAPGYRHSTFRYVGNRTQGSVFGLLRAIGERPCAPGSLAVPRHYPPRGSRGQRRSLSVVRPTGHLAVNERSFLFLVDYTNARRPELWGRVVPNCNSIILVGSKRR